MYNEILYFKQRTDYKRPVVAVMMDVAASGGYYIACACDEIVAHRTTVTGSVGVIMQMVNFRGTLDKIGVETEALKSGQMKDAGSPFRRLRPEERELFQKLIDQFFDRFVEVVAKGRPGMDEQRIRAVADGRVYSAPQALELGFIDKIGTLRDALADVKDRIGARKVRVVTYQRPLGYKPNIYAETPAAAGQFNVFNIQLPQDLTRLEPQFLYLWAPGI
jgi:protease-4